MSHTATSYKGTASADDILPLGAPAPVRYPFIDGGCLRECLKKMARTYTNTDHLNINYATFTHRYTKVFYYDALPGKSPKKIRQPTTRGSRQRASYLISSACSTVSMFTRETCDVAGEGVGRNRRKAT